MAYPPFHPKATGSPPLALTAMEFNAAFPSESEVVERKTGVGTRALQEAAVAFSNGDGGVVLIGVQDDGAIVGRELTQGVADDIHRVFREVREPGRYDINSVDVDGRTVVVLSIARRVDGFAQTSDGRVLVPRGTRKEALFGPALQRFLNERGRIRFEESSAGLSMDGVTSERLEQLAERFGWSEGASSERLSERGLVAQEGGSGDLTVCGALCLLEQPDDVLGKAFIEVFRYRPGGREPDRRFEVRGPVYEQVEGATRAVMDELGTEMVVLGLHRHELPRIPRRVLREAIANAAAHRTYEQSGRAVRIELRSDSVTVISPGNLPEPVTEQNIRDSQSARNLHLIDVLRRFRLAEDAGEGVDMMQDLMRDEMLDPPRFSDTGHSVRVTLPIRSAVAPAERAWVREVEQRGEIEPADRLLLVHAARGEILTNTRARAILGVDQIAARAALHRLRDAGFLYQEGRRAATSYVLESSLAPPAGLRLSAEELETLVFEIAQEGEPLTNAKVRARTGLDRVETLRVLDALVRAGRLIRQGERRGSRYVVPDHLRRKVAGLGSRAE